QRSASRVCAGRHRGLWLTNDGRLRLELQSDSGDAQIVVGDKTFSVYDASSNTVYTGTLPERDQSASKDTPPTLAGIQQGLAKLGRMWDLSGARPGTNAGQPSYTVRIAPKGDGGGLGAAELAWDAARGVPLRAAIYAQGQSAPVLELKATEISYGKVAASDVEPTAPAGAKKVELNPALGTDSHGNPTTV